jgi:lipoprotein-anchoring transpeptidase ErfK/SrfK
MFHSVLFDWAGNEIIDGRLGTRASHGCIRLRFEDSKWLYETVPIGTTVFIQ